jgi:hypothetical protein
LLLTEIDFHPTEFLEGKSWTSAAQEFAGRMVSTIIGLDRALHIDSEITPEPSWATESRLSLQSEKALRIQLLEAEAAVEKAQRRKEQLQDELKTAGAYRGLLFEKGKPLENIIIQALRLLGFAATPFRDSESEFDVVFESEEGRLIGEAEGKDSKAINVDKLRQLFMNVHEDLRRENVTAPAKAVLLGNGFRLQPLSDRPDPFTDKCQSAAASSSTALVFTADLFRPVQYLVDASDAEYARACRLTLLSSVGRATFLAPPAKDESQDETRIEEA